MTRQHYLFSVYALFIFIFAAACSEAPEPVVEDSAIKRDTFTYANYSDVVVRHVGLDLAANFETKTLAGTADIDFEVLTAGTNTLVLDTRALEITSVTVGGQPVDFSLAENDPHLGSRLEIWFPEGASSVTITYRTSPAASGLQWLSPEQTAGKTYPFMFSQSQAIHARSWVPIQDTPAVRITYSARVTTPPELLAVMSASQDPDTPRDGDYEFSMPQPIPAYLMAIAIGDMEFRAISDTIGVYAESYIIDAATAEFADTPLMEASNEKFYGPYRWGRYDLLVLPPSFPYGGMENPRLSFLTPTLIAGDKSLTNVVAHELAHSWSGNLVTNSTWRDSWINEGITSYVENRVMEDLYGRERAVMEQVLGKADWQRDMEAMENQEMTALALPNIFAEPFDAFTNIAYVKGQFFLHFLEERFGREVFDPFLKGYFDHFAFQSISTEDFVTHMMENLLEPNPGKVTDAEIEEWLYGTGMPATTPNPQSDVFTRLAEKQAAFLAGDINANVLNSDEWTTHEWLRFINTLPEDMDMDLFRDLDETYDLSVSTNAEIAFAWYMISLQASYLTVINPLEEFLIRVGRGKFIYPLYQRLVDIQQRDWALKVYEQARPGYHPIAQTAIDGILGL